jgi:hypothetical protein
MQQVERVVIKPKLTHLALLVEQIQETVVVVERVRNLLVIMAVMADREL